MILLLHDVETRIAVSRFILQCTNLCSLQALLYDTDAFFCTNIDLLGHQDSTPTGEVLLPSEEDFEMVSLVSLLSSRRQMVIVDDLNSLYSMASDGHRSEQLAIILNLLSHNARMNHSWAIATAYTTELAPTRDIANRRLSGLGGVVIDTELRDGSVRLKGISRSSWPNGEFRFDCAST